MLGATIYSKYKRCINIAASSEDDSRGCGFLSALRIRIERLLQVKGAIFVWSCHSEASGRIGVLQILLHSLPLLHAVLLSFRPPAALQEVTVSPNSHTLRLFSHIIYSIHKCHTAFATLIHCNDKAERTCLANLASAFNYTTVVQPEHVSMLATLCTGLCNRYSWTILF